MASFSKGIPRWMALSFAMAVFLAVPPEMLGRGPDICVWKHILHLSACPACGSTRALAAFFHGHLTQALAYNHNVLLTGPLMIGLLVQDLARALLSPLRRHGRGGGPVTTPARARHSS